MKKKKKICNGKIILKKVHLWQRDKSDHPLMLLVYRQLEFNYPHHTFHRHFLKSKQQLFSSNNSRQQLFSSSNSKQQQLFNSSVCYLIRRRKHKRLKIGLLKLTNNLHPRNTIDNTNLLCLPPIPRICNMVDQICYHNQRARNVNRLILRCRCPMCP